MDTMTLEQAREKVKRPLENLPELPDETDQQNDFIGGDVEEVINDGELTKEQKQDKLRGTKSTNGELWEPLIHSYPPSETAKGAWKKRRRKKGETAEGQPNAEFTAAAQNAAILYANLNYLALGEGAEVDERVLPMVVQGFESYYREKGIQELPAWAGLAIGCVNYTATVATKPKPKERVKSWVQKCLSWIRPKKQKTIFEDIIEETHAHTDSRE